MLILEKFTYRIFKDRDYSRLTAILFIFSPASAHFNSFYSESFYTLCTFSGTWQFYKHQGTWKSSIYSAFWFMLATILRSNGILYISVSGYPILMNFVERLYNLQYRRALKTIPLGIAVALMFLIPYGLILLLPCASYCVGPN